MSHVNCGHLLKECMLFLQLKCTTAKYILSIVANFSPFEGGKNNVRCIFVLCMFSKVKSRVEIWAV